MRTIKVGLDKRSYDIHIGLGLLDRLEDFLPPGLSPRCLLVTDAHVDRYYGRQVSSKLEQAGFSVTKAVVPPGETLKSFASARELYDAAFDHKLDRKSPVVALGGGVVGDLAGFIAATYMRGVPFIQLPTTLLAQVDSSVGGKVAINHPRGKNIIGAFYQPQVVVIDTSVLHTLPPRELRAAMAEVIKYGVIKDASFFDYLEGNMDRVMSLEDAVIQKIVVRCCEIKAEIVEKDEREAGLRAVLNFGHTVGHAIEALGNYQLRKHGEAVAVGMVVAGRLAVSRGLFKDAELNRLSRLLKSVPLDTELPAEWDVQRAVELMVQDKKAYQGEINFVLPETIGRVRLEKISPEELKAFLLNL